MLKEMAKKLPEQPGVYIMKDGNENIIYIGKAKNLKNRVSQYFQSSKRHAPKIIRMIENIRDFSYLLADTELEALLLECRLIKDLQPMYNSQMKNDLSYIYLRLTTEDKFPTFELAVEKADENICFGPYKSPKSVERALAVLQDNYKLRHCKSFAVKKSGCLNYQLGYCLAPCTEGGDSRAYMKQVEEAVSFLEGKNLELLKQLENKMKAAAEALEFTKAAKYRDDIIALRRLVSRQKAIGFTQGNRNMVAIERISDSMAKLFILQGSHIIYKSKIELNTLNETELKLHIIDLVLTYVGAAGSRASHIDKQEVDQVHIVYSYLKNKKGCSYILIPKSWLKKSSISRLEQGVEKLLNKEI